MVDHIFKRFTTIKLVSEKANNTNNVSNFFFQTIITRILPLSECKVNSATN